MLALFWVYLKHLIEFLEVPRVLFASLATFNMYVYVYISNLCLILRVEL